jgi:hypothetical protein
MAFAFVEINQALGVKSAKLMRSNEKKTISGWLLEQTMRIVPGRMVEFIINRSTQRITQAANAIALKDYSRFIPPQARSPGGPCCPRRSPRTT